MGKTYKDRRIQKIEEKGYTPKVLKEEYKRSRLRIKDITDDTDQDTDERAE